eukprot:Hpha_TRINITY_DN14560_c0_g1::TRINITY_DN14560_c0_g1_i1::g.46924::m.46924
MTGGDWKNPEMGGMERGGSRADVSRSVSMSRAVSGVSELPRHTSFPGPPLTPAITESPSPRRVAFADPHAGGDQQSVGLPPPGTVGGTDVGAYSHDGASNSPGVIPQQLSIGDIVEVRDSEGEPWKEGRVQRMLVIPTLVPAPGDRFGRYLTVEGPPSMLLISPEGTEQAFTWKHVRIPDADELARRKRDRQEAEDAERRHRAEQEERRHIHELLRSREMRLAERLRDEAEERAVTAERIRQRQIRGDYRVIQANTEIKVHAAKLHAEEVKLRDKRRVEREDLRQRLSQAREIAVADQRCRAFSQSPMRAQWSPRRGVPADLQAEAAAAALLHADEALVASLPVELRGTTSHQAMVECNALQKQQEADIAKFRARAKNIQQRQLTGAADNPGDRVLVGAVLHERWKKWRGSALYGSKGPRDGKDGDLWSDEDSADLSRDLRRLAARMTLESRRTDHVARVKRMADSIDRSLAPHRPPAVVSGGRKITTFCPFDLSKGRRPPQALSAKEFREQIRMQELEARTRMIEIKKLHAARGKDMDSARRQRVKPRAASEPLSVPAPSPPAPAAERESPAPPEPVDEKPIDEKPAAAEPPPQGEEAAASAAPAEEAAPADAPAVDAPAEDAPADQPPAEPEPAAEDEPARVTTGTSG